MTLAGKAAALFGYRTIPTALLAIATYLAIIVAIGVTDVLPAVPTPEKQGGLSLEEAYEDLMHITANPHPYNSHANDHVRAYLLARLTALADTYPHVHVVDDRTTNVTYVSTDLARGYSGHGVYFEGTNLLVKVDGTDTAESSTGGAVLFSAHYDSVSTARGATDDGMGVATLLQLVHYFAAARRVPRTAVFNINNGEEDGLHGAHAFMSHPYSNLPSTFLNLEGAAAGGPPIVFRATSTAPVRALSRSRNQGLWRHPHANVLSADAFARGVIRSGTDYSVYASPLGGSKRGSGEEEGGEKSGEKNGNNGKGMAGLDLAFYKGRSRYHTAYDAVPYTVGGRRSLWAMMEAGRGIGVGLLGAPEEGEDSTERGEDAVYFDLFKSTIIIFRLCTLLAFNVLALLVGPAVLALLFFCERFPLCGRFLGRDADEDGDGDGATRPLLRDDLSSTRRRSATPIPGFHAEDEDETPVGRRVEMGKARAEVVWRHAAFWAALCAACGVLGLLGWGYVVVNPFAVYASPYVVLASFTSAVYLTLITVLGLPFSLPFLNTKPIRARHRTRLLTPAQRHKQTIFLHLYALTWLLLLAGTLGITHVRPGIGGGYLLSAWNGCVWAGCVLGVVEGLFARAGKREEEREEGREEEEADERTPLILGRGGEDQGDDRGTRKDEEDEEEGLATAWWLAQFAVSVPVPLILFGQVAALLLDAVPQTMADGGAPSLVYAVIALPALLLVLPLAPFARKLGRSRALSVFVLVVFWGTTVYAMLAFPFVEGAELKVFFQQSVAFPRQNTTTGHGLGRDLDLDTFGGAPTVATSLTGAKRYLRTHLIPRLPSARGKRVWCVDAAGRPQLATCAWDSSGLWPVLGSSTFRSQSSLGPLDARRFFEAQVKATGPRSAFISVKGRNTRACRVYFDSMPVESYAVRHLDAPSSVASPPPVAWRAAAGRTWEEEDEDIQASFVGGSAAAASGAAGVREVRLWSRTWDLALGVAFSWAPPAGGNHTSATTAKSNSNSNSTTVMEGRIACEWAEYESGMVDTGAVLGACGDDGAGVDARRNTSAAGVPGSGAKIPAFEEVLAYLPEWAAVSKASDGLVEAWMPFVVG